MNSVNRQPSINKNSYSIRIFLLLLVVSLFVIFIMVRIFNLQILKGSYYKAIADNQHGTQQSINANRGEIFFTPIHGNPVLVATNVAKNMVYAVPKEVADKPNTAAKLAKLLDMDLTEVANKVAGSGNFSVIKKQVDEDISETLKNLDLPGIYLQAQDVRFYPEKDLASQVIGFLGFKDDQRIGQYGVEGKYESNLAGTIGVLDADTDPSGRWITTAARSFIPAVDGDDVYLTIDRTIQFKAEEVLKKTLQEHTAPSGSIVVIQPKTGAVLAMANEPGFDLNNYGKVVDQSVYNNRVLSADYEPGSVFKPITMAMAINEHKVTPQTTYIDEGVLQIDDKQIKNSDPTPRGTQNMIQVLTESLNTGAVFAEQKIGNDKFKKYVQKFGFGKLVDLGLSGQVQGDLNNLNRKGDIFFATASYGQGITVTPIQLVQAFTAIANGGKMMTPYVIDKIQHSDGTEDRPRPKGEEQILDPQAASQVAGMMVEVVESGHGKKAAVPGYYIAGKTGTAQVAYKDRPGYDPNTNIGSFIGFGPVDDPQFLMLVRIDNPSNVKFAESTAAPAFGEVAAFILNYMQVAPSRK